MTEPMNLLTFKDFPHEARREAEELARDFGKPYCVLQLLMPDPASGPDATRDVVHITDLQGAAAEEHGFRFIRYLFIAVPPRPQWALTERQRHCLVMGDV